MEDCQISSSKKNSVNLDLVNNGNVNINRFDMLLGLLNIRSILSKSDTIYEILLDGLDFLVLVETWHGSSDNLSIKLAMPPGYHYIDSLRPHDPYHGGLIIFFRSYFKYKRIDLPLFISFEAMAVKFFINGKDCVMLALYRPGSVQPNAMFFTELVSVLEHISLLSSRILLAGDFNVHVERNNDPHAVNLLEIFDMFQLINHINQPTHISGGTLDLIVSTHDFPVYNSRIFPSGLYSDHSLIYVTLPMTRFDNDRKNNKKIKKLVRSWKNINESVFVTSVTNSPLSKPCQSSDVDEEFNLLNKELLIVVDKVAPLHIVQYRCDLASPWFDEECRIAKRYCRKIEKKYRRSLKTNYKNEWVAALEAKNRLFSEKRNHYWSKLIKENSSDSKNLWNVVNRIICRNNDYDKSADLTSSQFMKFFQGKIDKIMQFFDKSDRPIFDNCKIDEENLFSDFSVVTESEIKKIILSSSTKTCSLDIIPTHIFKKYIDLFITYITSLINLSLKTGIFPSYCKHAIVVPRLKKLDANKNDISNYRPISNLGFVSKVIERAVTNQLIKYLNLHSLMPVNQSGYRCHHSTETALLHVLSEIFAAIDEQNVSLLTFLDMSAAFDCVDHQILIDRLFYDFGVTGVPAKWFKSYLIGRTYQVSFKSCLSEVITLSSGVPQGSVLGPILFVLYTAQILEIIQSFGCMCHAYADDIQVIVTGKPEVFQCEVHRLIACLSDIDSWMSKNCLRLNQCKSQFLPIGTWQQLSKININSVHIGEQNIKFCGKASNLGCVLDSRLSMKDHIKMLSSACTYQLQRLYRVRKSLDKSSTQTLIHAFVLSRLDYCNSLFYDLPCKSIAVLQSIQNRAAKVVAGGLKFNHVTPILRELHWLNVEKRIIFKICVLMFKAMNGLLPQYLADKFIKRSIPISGIHLRSDDMNLMTVHGSQLRMGSRNIAVSGPIVWNGLPKTLRTPGLSIDIFKNKLKTYLFTL